jgi:hypothetical protein
VVNEMAQASVVLRAFKEGDAPAIGVVIGHTRALCKPGEAKGCIGGVFAIES